MFFNDIVLALILEELKFEPSFLTNITIELIIYQEYVNSHLPSFLNIKIKIDN